MCGIAAILDPSDSVGRDAESRILHALRHRGPDGQAAVRRGPARLLHTRLAIIDVAGGDQPLHSEDGTCSLVANGEIYNHARLRQELEARGHEFATRSDCEAILHGYEEWGVDVVDHLNGIFAFALWDEHRQRLILARDHQGVKPLYWWSDGSRLIAASEISAVLETGWMGPRVDPIALEHYFAWRFVPAPRTMFAGISKLAPATMLVSEGGRQQLRSFATSPGALHEDANLQELQAEITRQFEAAVRRQMMSDVPFGAFLSGGVDSAAIVAAMQGAGGGPTQTYTIGFPGSGEGVDERAAAARSAGLLGARHASTHMEQLDFVDALAQCVPRLEEPTGTASAPALFELSRFAAAEVKVVLSGQGADEPFGGYQRHQAAAALGVVDRIPHRLSGVVNGLAGALPRNERAKRAARLLDAPTKQDRLLGIFEITAAEQRAQLLIANAALEARAERKVLADPVVGRVSDRSTLEQALYLDTHLFLPDNLLLYGDKMSMAWGLEHRVPFLDREFLAFVERVPAAKRVRGLKRKWLYKRAMRDYVPSEIVDRPKHPFATPYDKWLRSSLGTAVSDRYAGNSELRLHVDPRMVDRLVHEHQSGRADHKRVLFCLLEFSVWHETFVEGRRVSFSRAA